MLTQRNRCSKGLRSLTAEYSIRDNGQGFVKTSDAAGFATAKAELLSIKALAGKGMSNITVLGPDDAMPTGCAVFVVSSAAAAFLEVKGRVDVAAEINKAQTKLKKARQTVTKQKSLLGDVGFGEKVSEAVKDLEQKKLVEAEAEIENYEKTIEQFEKMKLESN
jgi:valyl-tRNA synthetase